MNDSAPKQAAAPSKDIPAEALAREEIKLSLETEKRMQDVKAEVAKANTEKPEPKEHLNQDG